LQRQSSIEEPAGEEGLTPVQGIKLGWISAFFCSCLLDCLS